jgi:hypothetical protein
MVTKGDNEVTFISRLMHSNLDVVDIKNCVTYNSKMKHTLKLLQHVSDYTGSIIRSIDSYLIKTTRNVSKVLVVCAVGVWRHIQDLWCVCAHCVGLRATNEPHWCGSF